MPKHHVLDVGSSFEGPLRLKPLTVNCIETRYQQDLHREPVCHEFPLFCRLFISDFQYSAVVG